MVFPILVMLITRLTLSCLLTPVTLRARVIPVCFLSSILIRMIVSTYGYMWMILLLLLRVLSYLTSLSCCQISLQDYCEE